MVHLFTAAAFILIIACHRGHGSKQNHSYQCGGHPLLETPAGEKLMGCQHPCKKPYEGKVGYSGFPCVTVPSDAWRHMTAGVNYTCSLGICDKQHKCKPYGLLIGCWKPEY
uniref:Evasin n=1 Tax=Rhipicephalus zambeziensis TaxID=60191 RepID=A0A224YCU5_9ACAR